MSHVLSAPVLYGPRPLSQAAQSLIQALESVNMELAAPSSPGTPEDSQRLAVIADELRRQIGDLLRMSRPPSPPDMSRVPRAGAR